MSETHPDDPFIRRLEEAPPEDEEISAAEEASVQGVLEELAKGYPLISLDEIKREFGIE